MFIYSVKKKYLYLVLICIFPVSAICGNIDPIPEVNVTSNGISVRDGGAATLAKQYPLVQITAAVNTGAVSSYVVSQHSNIILPKDTKFQILIDAIGDLSETVVEHPSDSPNELTGWHSMVATAQRNDTATVSSVAYFDSTTPKNGTRIIRAVGNEIHYEDIKND